MPGKPKIRPPVDVTKLFKDKARKDGAAKVNRGY